MKPTIFLNTEFLHFSFLSLFTRNGFRYFAAETLNHHDEKALNQRKYPNQQTGFYVAEPIYAEILRQALKIGFKVIAYEHEDQCDYGQTTQQMPR